MTTEDLCSDLCSHLQSALDNRRELLQKTPEIARNYQKDTNAKIEQGKDAIAASVSNLLIQSLLSKTSREDRSIVTLIEKLLAELKINPASQEFRTKIESLCEMERLFVE